MLWKCCEHKISLFQNTHFKLFILYYILLKYQFFFLIFFTLFNTRSHHLLFFSLEKHKIIIIIIKLFCISYSDLYICTSTIVCSKIWLFSTLSETFASMAIALYLNQNNKALLYLSCAKYLIYTDKYNSYYIWQYYIQPFTYLAQKKGISYVCK